MITVLLILALIVAVAAVVFALQNTTPVTVSFMVWQFKDQPLALILLLALAAGVLIGLLTILPGAVRNKWRTVSQRKKIEGLEKSLQEAQARLEQTKQEMAALQAKPEPPAPAAEPLAPPAGQPPAEASTAVAPPPPEDQPVE